MKIGITCYPTYGGSGVVATELGKALANHGHTVHFISYAMPFRLNEFSSNIYYHEVDVTKYPLFEYPPYSITLASKMADVISYEKLDLLHVHYAIPHAVSAFLAREMLKDKNDPNQDFKIITTLHGTDITIVGLEPSLIEAVRLGMNKSDGVTAVSDYLRRKTEEDFTPRTQVEVIPNFVDTKEFQRKHCPQFRSAFAKPDEKVLIHISNFRPLKRVKDVVKTFDKVNQKIPSWLLLVGDGPDRSDAEKLARDLGIANRIKFLGRQEAIIELLSISDIMLLPSESESFGLAALEAMACGVPVIASNVGGLPELIQTGETGCLHALGAVEEMAACAISMLGNMDTLQHFSQAARQAALRYDTSVVVPKYEAYYREILGG
ncbi:MAG: N-acetyl-alpha-D-glucosaminyl L-malate synthase BshA [Chlorobiales bacterium]|nr:N-acetyl-alpha-D-glucosaminyl L-malate synthase BshA [Chlorobiales bacterium]